MTDHEPLKKAFIEGYDRFADAIYRHLVFRVFSKARAEELMQETFLKVWQYLADGKRVDNMRAFLYQVANNLIIDESRKRKETSLDALQERSDFFEPSYDGEKTMERTLLAQQVIREFSCLDDDERTVLVMRYVDDLDPHEIAEILNTTANNVSVKINRALKKVKEKI